MNTEPPVRFSRRGIVDLVDSSRSPSPSPTSTSPPPPPPPPPSDLRATACITSSRSCSLRATISGSFRRDADASVVDTHPFFKIEAPISLLNTDAQRSLSDAERTNLTFVSIRPSVRLAVAVHIPRQSISAMSFSRQRLPDRLTPIYRRLARTESLALTLTLSSPPTLVIPDCGERLIPHTREDSALLAAFQRIASPAATSPSPAVTLVLYLPGAAFTDAQAASLCESIPSTAPAGIGQPAEPRHSGQALQTLFGGLGAREVPPDLIASIVDPASPTTSAASTRDESPDSPPGYADAETDHGAPPSYPAEKNKEPTSASASRKRPRLEEDEGSLTSVAGGAAGEKALGGSVGAASTAHLGHVQQTLAQQLASAHTTQQALAQQLAAAQSAISSCLERLAAKEAELDERLAAADDKIDELDKAVASYEQAWTAREYIDERVEELRLDFIEQLDEKLEEWGLDIMLRPEVEDYVEQQVDYAVAELRESLASGVRVLFPGDYE